MDKYILTFFGSLLLLVSCQSAQKKINLTKEFTLEEGEKLHLKWDEPVVFKSHLLHEIGHTYGIDDIKHTIMEEKAMNRILNMLAAYKGEDSDSPLAKQIVEELNINLNIDHAKELYICHACELNSYSSDFENHEQLAAILFEFMPEPKNGYQINGTQYSAYNLYKVDLKLVSSNEENGQKEYQIVFYGSNGSDEKTWEYDLEIDTNNQTTESSALPIFITWDGEYSLHGSNIHFGQLIGKDGAKEPVMIERNFNHMFPFRISTSGEKYNFFEGFYSLPE